VAEPRKPDSRSPSNPFVTGPTKKLDPTHATAPVRRGVPETTRPVARPDLVTEGMKAHRREIERRKRAAAIEKLHNTQQSEDALRVFWKGAAWVALFVAIGFAYWSLQNKYGNKWPMWDVWIFLAVALFASIGGLFWYLNKKDL
jgi:hypothetical protein